MSTRLATLARAARGVLSSRSGSSAVEFACVAPILIALTFGAFDYGRAYVEGVRLSGAAREGAQQALYDPANWQDEQLIEEAALEEYAGHALTQEQMSTMPVSATSQAFYACENGAEVEDGAVPCPDGSLPGQFVRVRLTSSVALTLPYPWASTGTTAVASAAVVRVR
ncbi:MAG: TadE/TadG family type IV pilus assembly protein [Geminicoccaceae bacterium]